MKKILIYCSTLLILFFVVVYCLHTRAEEVRKEQAKSDFEKQQKAEEANCGCMSDDDEEGHK